MRNKRENLRKVLKVGITVSAMSAMCDAFCCNSHSGNPVKKLACVVAGAAIGLLVGEKSSDAVVEFVDRVITSYEEDELYSEVL